MEKRVIALLVAAVCALSLFAGCASSNGTASSSSSSAASSATNSGEYTVDVELVGGSGKASVESPAKLTVKDGAMTLTVVWSSPNYDLMIVDGTQYKPVNTSGNSVFEIPVATVEEDLPIQAETTAMGTPHMIDYTLRFGSSTYDESAAATFTTQIDFHNASLGNGWPVQRSLDLKYATQFTVDYYEGGYKLACLGDGGRYLVVPEGATVPEGIDSDIVVLQQPIKDIYLVASDAMCLFDALDALDTISVSGIAKENWYIPSAIEAMENGNIVYGGKYNAPDYDTLLAKGVRLAIQSTMINHTPQVREKLIQLGIPVLTEQSSYESEPLGRTEWVKLYAALLDKEDLGQALFDKQVAEAQAVQGVDTGKSVAFFYINSNGAAVVRKPGDYVTKMIDLAGGKYLFDNLGDSSSMSTVTLEMERFYAQAKDADVIIYNATIDSGVDSINALIKKNELLGNFKAVRNGDVWVTEQNMYQRMMNTGDIIADFNRAFTGSSEPTTYLHKMA